jgi:hypothetical protein
VNDNSSSGQPNIKIQNSNYRGSMNFSGFSDNIPFDMEDVVSISFVGNEPIQLYAKQPKIDIKGNIQFEELRASLPDGPSDFESGRDYSFAGNLRITIYLSDSYTFANSFLTSSSQIIGG